MCKKRKTQGQWIVRKAEVSSGSTVDGPDMQKESAGLLSAPGQAHCNFSQVQL